MDIQNTPSSPFSALEQWEPISHPVTLDHPKADRKPFWGDDGFTFDDVLDMVNPLQHIPVASKTYQKATGDTASEGAKFVGGAVFGVLIGGPLGLATALVNAAVRHDTGKDLPEHALALVTDESATALVEAAVTKGEKPAEESATPLAKNASISSKESPTVSHDAMQTNFFVDNEAAQSLHPAERLLAISSYYADKNAEQSSDNEQQELERSPETSMRQKISETYRKVAEDAPTHHLGDV